MIDLEHIIERCKKRDIAAQRLLYERYANHLRNICSRYISDNHDIKDIVQDSFIKIISKIDQYKGNGSFEGWMSRVLINTAIKHLKKNSQKHVFSDLESLENSLSEDETVSHSITKEDEKVFNTYDSIEQANFTKEELLEVIMSIPQQYRIVFNLFHIEGYSHEDIAKTLEIDVSNSRIRLHRSRSLIREELTKRAKEQHLKNSRA